MNTDPASQNAKNPRGLYTLFFTEMWERFSYYGMRALLVLFMIDSVRGGMGMSDQMATAIYGLYTAGVYLAALPGGWIADRFLGARRAVWFGGITIAAGHFCLAIPWQKTFYLGLLLIVVGTGLLKPNISALVGTLYPEGGARRDAGFTIFYMGINIGAALGPLICSSLGEKLNWHFGFVAAGVGMLFGLAQFKITGHHLGEAGLKPGNTSPPSALEYKSIQIVTALGVLFLLLVSIGMIRLDPVSLAQWTAYIIVAMGFLYFGAIFLVGKLNSNEKGRVGVIIVLFIASALFWAGFEQSGSSLNLFAERWTQRVMGGFEIPTGWFQSLGPVFIITLAPAVAAFWIWLAKRGIDPALTTKFGLALMMLGSSFIVMSAAAAIAVSGHKASPNWLVTTYLIHTIAELCLSPVGLSSVVRLAPKRLVGQLMGTWFLATSLGNLLAGLIAGRLASDQLERMPAQFMQLVWMPLVTGVVLMLIARPIRNWMRGTA